MRTSVNQAVKQCCQTTPSSFPSNQTSSFFPSYIMLLTCRARSGVLASTSLTRLNIPRSYSTALASPFLASLRANRPQYPQWHRSTQIRGAKRKAVIDLNDIPQGAIDAGADGLPPQDDEESDYPPLLQQVYNNMLKFSHCVVLTRVGGFYEVRPSLYI